jgi:hypothetical protein
MILNIRENQYYLSNIIIKSLLQWFITIKANTIITKYNLFMNTNTMEYDVERILDRRIRGNSL